MNHFHSSYQKVQVETTDGLRLVVMLYEGGINFLEQAKRRMESKEYAEKGILINKVVAIVSELQGSLNMDGGGEVAGSLDRLYDYMISRLIDANSSNDVAILDEVAGHMRTLKDAWKDAAEKEPQAGTRLSVKAAVRQEQPGRSELNSAPAAASPYGKATAGVSAQPIEFVG